MLMYLLIKPLLVIVAVTIKLIACASALLAAAGLGALLVFVALLLWVDRPTMAGTAK